MLHENTRLLAATLAAACVVVAGLGPLPSAEPPRGAKADANKPAKTKAATDRYGDPLPVGALQRLGTVRFRHDSTAIAFSPNGKILASGGRNNVIRLFDADSGKELRRLIGHQTRSYNGPADQRNFVATLVGATGTGGVNSVAFSPSGKVLASGGWDDTVRLWDVKTGRELRKIAAHKAMVGRVVFSPDGRILASRGALDGTVRLWDPITGTQLQKFVGLSNINPWRFNHDLALAVSPDSKTVVATARGALVFFDVASGAELKRLPAHVYGITVAYSPDGKLLASGGVDQGKDVYSLRIWDVKAGKELRKCKLPKNEPPTYLSWDPNNNGKFAAVVAEDVMHIFDAHTGNEVTRLNHYWPSRVAYARGGKKLASAGSGPTIRFWDPATGKELYRDYEGHRSGVTAVAVTRKGKWIASGGGDGVRLWDPGTGKVARTIPVKGGVTCLAFDPDGRTLAFGGLGRVVHLWDVAKGKSAAEFKPHTNSVRGLAFSRDGQWLATGDAQATVRVWDVKRGKKVQEIDNKSATESLALAFGPNRRTLVCAGAWNDSSFLPKKGQTLRINGKEVKVKEEFVLKLQGVLMTRKEGYYVLGWDVKTGKEVHKFGGLRAPLRSLAYSPDGKLVAGASRDGKICIWDAKTGKERLHIVAHPGQSAAPFGTSPCLAFSPDSKTLASAGSDHTIRFWDVVTAKETGQFRAPDSAFTSIAFSTDGKKLISGSADTGVLVWDVGAARNTPPGEKSKVITLQ
jgi:WD40 repeat protein